ncbi:hypothetical protein [Lysobacter sp. cf310]|uniref:hypothetical protein n=1 Tax=Lysobacter sp. cf310 TaxID=1761790 RepID=UPI0008F233E1|nr:hypothetical protein [Lysobacter sp. cf310]SFK65120.1 hypothetical protein SAMN04487938_1428 [Lysobacter sp. cf310]
MVGRAVEAGADARISNERLFERYRGVPYEIGIAGHRGGRFDPEAWVDGSALAIVGAGGASHALALADIRARVEQRIRWMLLALECADEPL